LSIQISLFRCCRKSGARANGREQSFLARILPKRARDEFVKVPEAENIPATNPDCARVGALERQPSILGHSIFGRSILGYLGDLVLRLVFEV
jgi:hypothetical protein